MSNKILKYFLAILLLLLIHKTYSQDINSSLYRCETYGKEEYGFSMGIRPMDLTGKFSIRADKMTYQLIENELRNNNFSIQLDQRNRYINIKYGYKDYYYYIDSLGSSSSAPELYFDLDLLNPKRIKACLISYGNAHILDKEKIEQLIFDYTEGRVMNLNEFTNLKSLIIQGRISCIDRGYGEYKGDPFLLNEISQITSLENLILFSPPYYLESLNPIFIDGPTNKLFELPNLKSISLVGVPYLPIPGNEWEKIEYFHTADIFFPELINLALIFKHFDKDTNDCNWHKYLKYTSDSIPMIIPQNGKYQTFYKNGKSLCEGNYLNGAPDGEWRFWYEDGRLCEQRNYKEGRREGVWYFLRPLDDYYPQIDTILILQYKNDTLVYRQDRFIDDSRIGLCYENDSHYAGYALYIVDSKIAYDQNQNVIINKEMRSYNLETQIANIQIPDGFLETWTYSQEGWTYLSEVYCGNRTKVFTTFMQGQSGESSWYECKTNVYRSSDGLIWKNEHVIDYRNCINRVENYLAENDTAEFLLRNSHDYGMGSEERPCVQW